MKRPFLPVHKILVATFAGISFASLLVASPSLADPNQPFGSLESDRNTNSLTGNSSEFDMLDLIHRANLGTNNFNPEQQNQQLDDAAAAFKARQEKLLQTPQQSNSNSPTTSGGNTPSLIILPANQ
ncbi:hypothetical protein [Anabaena catenula]|uniref:Uncharacterized protein n=1 Tax=Anabaena catenula FACHB-362 TaxID=2692877 RepID=A0ABR8J9A5_9NOST|nr:hypothetical protein [Anabaena catenula]MBD2694959.1 hypothetical protein [Anabaena catenula FACHB-362]